MHRVEPPEAEPGGLGLPGELEPPARQERTRPVRFGDPEHCGRGIGERAKSLLRFPQPFFGATALGDVREQNGERVLGRIADTKGANFEPATHGLGAADKPCRLAGQRHPAADLEPVILQVRYHLARGFARRIVKTRHLREQGVDFEEAIVDRTAVLVEQHLADADTLVHGVEQRPIAAFAPIRIGYEPVGLALTIRVTHVLFTIKFFGA
jgi:hypothetical protein